SFLGAAEVESRLKSQRLHMDSFFTGGDFPTAAMQQISAAVHRRMGKREGLSNTQKRQVHDVYVKDKQDQKVRRYRIFYDLAKYEWWSQKHKRWLLPDELLCAMGYPALGQFAEVAGVQSFDLKNLSDNQKDEPDEAEGVTTLDEAPNLLQDEADEGPFVLFKTEPDEEESQAPFMIEKDEPPGKDRYPAHVASQPSQPGLLGDELEEHSSASDDSDEYLADVEDIDSSGVHKALVRLSFETERVQRLLNNPCKCADKTCYQKLEFKSVMAFLDAFEARSKSEQDTILALALEQTEIPKPTQKVRKDYYFLGVQLRRVCFQALLGISSHRLDRMGAIDLRYGKRVPKPSPLTASIDSFCTVLYNSIAEPLPDQ
ncbi:Uncharacterized protein SCF082_LOCUS13347, partial [Durusdinium trenchii]